MPYLCLSVLMINQDYNSMEQRVQEMFSGARSKSRDVQIYPPVRVAMKFLNTSKRNISIFSLAIISRSTYLKSLAMRKSNSLLDLIQKTSRQCIKCRILKI